MNKLKVWINGKYVSIDDAKISIFDRGYLYGDGIFETMRSYTGIVFRLNEHLNRLFASLKVIRIAPPYDKVYLKNLIYKTLKLNCLGSAYIRLTITRGQGRFGVNYADELIPNVVLVAKEFGEYPNWMHLRGINAKVVENRQNEYSPLANIKSLNFLNNIFARLEAKEGSYDDAILLNTKAQVTESATANIFLVNGNRLTTPSLDSGILPGITRGVIIEIASNLKLKVREGKISYRELLGSDEVFLTNSLIEILPVTRVDARKIGNGVVGDITKLLHISYQKQVIRETLRKHS